MFLEGISCCLSFSADFNRLNQIKLLFRGPKFRASGPFVDGSHLQFCLNLREGIVYPSPWNPV